MSNTLKKLVSALVCAFVLASVVPTKKAEAGMAIIAVGIATNVQEGTPAANVYTGLFAGALAGAVISQFLIGGYVSLAFAFLDAQGNLPADVLATELSKRYSFIDSQESVFDLANAIRAKYEATPHADGKAVVSMTGAEVREILAPVALTEAQLNQISADLE